MDTAKQVRNTSQNNSAETGRFITICVTGMFSPMIWVMNSLASKLYVFTFFSSLSLLQEHRLPCSVLSSCLSTHSRRGSGHCRTPCILSWQQGERTAQFRRTCPQPRLTDRTCSQGAHVRAGDESSSTPCDSRTRRCNSPPLG